MVGQTDIHQLLQRHFGFREFLEGQEAVVQAILRGEDALVIMPTGGGKSLCYQLSALALEGITLVVSPLIALMKDQVDSLVEKKIPATFINSTLAPAEMDDRIARMARGEYRLVYVAPERFKSERFVRTIAPLSIALFAVDEAHCISQWGHDFRPDYLRLRRALKDLGHPQVAALTATATPEVREDIVAQLGLGQDGRRPPRVFVSGFARHNLTLGVSSVYGRDDKLSRIAEFIRQLRTGIIYCATRKNVEAVTSRLRGLRTSCVAYHAGMSDDQRTKAQEKFMQGQCDVAVATNAFGMGIDRADLRFVIHFDIPGSVEAYYQEAGRAGRDGEPARCELLFNYADVRTQEFFIEGSNPTREVIAGLHETLLRLCKKGPVEMPISEIAELVPEAENEMAVGSALYLLERANFIQRDYVHGSRTYTTSLVKPARSLDELKIDYERLDTKRERDFAKLRRIIEYADHRGCRHHFILQYFGEEPPEGNCAVCDNCLAHRSSAIRQPTDEETVIIQKALSCVARVDGRFGRGRIAQVLVGSHSKEVVDAGLDRLSTYGLLADEGPDYVWALLDALVRAGCLAVSGGQYPTLSLTELGGQVMRRQTSVPLLMPETISAKPVRRKTARARKAPVEETYETAGSAYDEALFEALRKWRREKSAVMNNLPAYLIYSDRTLEEIARRLPRTNDELLEVRGIGEAKARQFGAETLAVVRQFAR
jgi:ATP-dependent DNA helicase RecQ